LCPARKCKSEHPADEVKVVARARVRIRAHLNKAVADAAARVEIRISNKKLKIEN
jgi:hypothetical protein